MINFCIFAPISIAIALINIRILFRWAYLPYIIALLLLILVEFFGVTVMGAKRWINLGFARIQPSELAKLSLVLGLAKYFHNLSYQKIIKLRY